MLTYKVRDLRKKDQFIIDDAYLNGYAKLVSPFATLAYLSLCRHANTDQKAFPSLDKIAEEFSISKPSVKKGLQELERLNIIRSVRVGKRQNNEYWLLDKSEWVPKDGLEPYTNSRGKETKRNEKGKFVKGEVNDTAITESDGEVNLTVEVNAVSFQSEVNDMDGKDTHRKDAHVRISPNAHSDAPKREEVHFAKEAYDSVLDEYQRLRGIVLQGKEFDPVMREIKTMFLSSRTVEDIIGCMKWLASGKEEWMTRWTIRTVKMKLPEWKAGADSSWNPALDLSQR